MKNKTPKKNLVNKYKLIKLSFNEIPVSSSFTIKDLKEKWLQKYETENNVEITNNYLFQIVNLLKRATYVKHETEDKDCKVFVKLRNINIDLGLTDLEIEGSRIYGQE